MFAQAIVGDSGSRAMAQIEVSVIIPAFRARLTIGRAIESVLAQTVSAFEIIVVNDGSPDDLPSAVAPFGNRVRLINQANGGVARARNTGINASSGTAIAFLDADDYWERDKLETQLNVLRAYPSVGIIASGYFIEMPGKMRRPSIIDGVKVNDVLKPKGGEIIAVAASVWTSTTMIRRDALKNHRFDPSVSPAEDRELWIRILAENNGFIVPRPLATAVLEPDSLSRSDADRGYAPMIEVLRRHSELMTRNERRFYEARVFKGWAGAHLQKGEARRAARPAMERCARQPLELEAWWILLKSLFCLHL